MRRVRIWINEFRDYAQLKARGLPYTLKGKPNIITGQESLSIDWHGVFSGGSCAFRIVKEDK